MQFISAEEFLKQEDKVQKVFLNWWKPQMYDLFFRNFTNETGFLKGIYKGCIEDNEVLKSATNDKSFLPLLTEGQLRHFIEDKTNCKLNIGNISKVINIYKKELDIPYETDLLQAYWKVALQIAKEEV